MPPNDGQNKAQPELNSPEQEAKAKGETSREKAEDMRQKTLEEAGSQARSEIAKVQAELQASGHPLSAQTQEYLEKYFQGSIDRFDADKDGKISKTEAETFKQNMLKKTGEIISTVKEGANKENEAKEAAAKVEPMKPEDVEKNLGTIKDVGDIADLGKANEELSQLQTQNGAFQQQIQGELGKIQQFGTEYNEFQKKQEGFGHFVEGARALGGIFGLSNRNEEIAGLKKKLDDTKAAVNTLLNSLAAKKKILDGNGEKIKAAIAKARQDAITDRDKKVEEIEASKKEQQSNIDKRKQEHDKIVKAREEMEKRRQGIEDKQKKTAEVKANWNKTKEDEKLDYRESSYKDAQTDVDAELKGYETILDNPDVPPEYKERVKVEYEKAKQRKHQTALGLQIIDGKRKSGTEFEKGLEGEQAEAAKNLNDVNNHLDRQKQTQEGLEKNISTLEALQLQYATSTDEAKKFYNDKIDLLDKHSEGVNDFVLNAAIGRDSSLGAMQKAADSLGKMSVEAKGFWDFVNPLEAVGSLSKGIGGAFSGVAKWIDGNVRDVLNMTRNSDSAFEQGLYYLTQGLSVFSGFVSGGCELIGGLFTLTGSLASDIGSAGTALLTWDSKKFHGFDTLKGLGAIIGYDGVRGEFSLHKFGETWGNVGKALVGYGENWGYHKDPATGKETWRDEYGTGAGKVAFNVMSMLIGAGEAKGALEGGEVAAETASVTSKASLAAEAARLAAIDAAETVGFFTGRGAQIAAFAETFVVELGKKLVPEFIKDASEAASLETGALAKTGAFVKSVAGSAAEGLGKVYDGVKGVVTHPIDSAASVLKTGAKITADIIAMPYKLTWNTLKAFGNAGNAFRNVFRAIANPEAVAAATASENMGRAANVIEKEGAAYSQARVRLEEIIQEDPKLSAKLAEIDKLPVEEMARQRLALESEAVQKMVNTDPDLAHSYINVRTASRQLSEEATSFMDATRSNIDRIKTNPEIEAAYQEYHGIQTDLQRAREQGLPSVERNLQDRLDTFSQDKTRFHQAQQYEAALQAEQHLQTVNYPQQLRDLEQSLAGRNHAEAVQVANEVSEARAALAPPNTTLSDRSVTNSPNFSRKFTERYEEAVQRGDTEAMQQLRQSLGTDHNGEISRTLEGIENRHRFNIPEAPEGTTKITQGWREQLMDSWEEATAKGDFSAYNELRNKYSGKAGSYIEWMEDIYKKHPQEARGIISDSAVSLDSALRANQQTTIELYRSLEERIQNGASQQELATETANLPKSWQEGLEQMRQRYNFTKQHAQVTGEIALNRLRSEFQDVVTPDMDAVKATEKLQSRYRTDSVGKSASAVTGERVVAQDIALSDGKYSMRVIDDGSVRLFNQSGEMVMTRAESKAVSAGLRITPNMEAKAVADLLAERYEPGKAVPGSEVGAGESRLVQSDLTLADGKQYSLKLDSQGQLALFDSSGTQVAPTKGLAAAPVQAPQLAATATTQPALAPAASPAATPSRAMRPFEAREAKIQDTIAGDQGLNTLNQGDELARQLARNKADVMVYENSAEFPAVKNRVSQLETELNAAKGTSAEAAAQQALDTYRSSPAYLQYQNYADIRNLVDRAEQAMTTPDTARALLADAQKTRVEDILRQRLEGSRLTPEEAARMLERENLPVPAGSAPYTPSKPVEVTLAGEKFTIRLNETGQFALLDEHGGQILPDGGRSLEYIAYAPKLDTPNLLAGQPVNSTVAFGTGSTTGDWLEATRMPDGKYRLTRVQNSAVAEVVENVEDLQIAPRQGGGYNLTWGNREYGCSETFTPPAYRSAKIILPPAELPAAAPALAPSAVPAVAPAGVTAAAPEAVVTETVGEEAAPEAAGGYREDMSKALERRRAARDTIHENRAEIIKLEDRLENMDQRIEAMKARHAPEMQIQALQDKYEALAQQLETRSSAVESAASEIWATRKDYWKARLMEKGEAISNFVGVQRRIDWLKTKTQAIGRAVEVGWKAAKLPYQYLREALQRQIEYTASTGFRYYAFGQVGHQIAERMEQLHEAAGARIPQLSAMLGDLAMDQYRILSQVAEGGKRSLNLPGPEQFASLSPKEKMRNIREAYTRLEGRETIGDQVGYNDVERRFVQDERDNVTQALADLREQGNLTPEAVFAALNGAIAPHNEISKGYEINVEGITVTVNKDGSRTIKGHERWARETPIKTQVNEAFTASNDYYTKAGPDVLQPEKEDQPPKTLDQFRDDLKARLAEAVANRLQGQNPGGGMRIDSTETNVQGQPRYTAIISPDGKIAINVDETWMRETYDAISARTPASANKSEAVAQNAHPAVRRRTQPVSAERTSPSEQPTAPAPQPAETANNQSYDPYDV